MSLTNLYITEREYELLAVHQSDVLVKVRYSLHAGERYVSVNAFEGDDLQGLVLLEADFGSEDDMAAYRAPDFVVREVSHDDRFSGGSLARTTAAQLRSLIDE